MIVFSTIIAKANEWTGIQAFIGYIDN